jgi:hypothetical protein
MINGMEQPRSAAEEHGRHDAQVNEAARAETLRTDAGRSLGENLEQADALIKAAFALAAGFAAARR